MFQGEKRVPQKGSIFTFHQDWWLPHVQPEVVESYTSQLSISQPVARILASRNFDGIKGASDFLFPNPDHLHDPFSLPDMVKAVHRILKAIDQEELVVIYGHDDVDGMTSALLLREAIAALKGRVNVYIPDRITEGIGLKWTSLNHLAREGARLIVTVDCGIEDERLLSETGQLSVDIIVTDHHEVSHALPGVIPFVNPKREESQYPFKELSGAGVGFKVAQALFQKRGKAPDRFFHNVCDLIALGTLADKVPLVDENRVFSRMGFDRMEAQPRVGLQAILNLFDGLREIHQHFIRRYVIPVLSSAVSIRGRNDGFDLLDASDLYQATQLAKNLFEKSQQWQHTMAESFERILRSIDEERVGKEEITLVIDDQTPLRALGACASKIMRMYRKPTFLLSFVDDHYVGEARAQKGYNLVELLHTCQDHLINYGGHKQAAGFSIFPEFVNDFQERLKALLEDIPKSNQSMRRLDAELDPSSLDERLLAELDMLIPFGRGNPSPSLLSRNVTFEFPHAEEEIEDGEWVGTAMGVPVVIPLYIIEHKWMETPSPGTKYDIVYRISTVAGHTPQIILNDLRKSQSSNQTS